MIRSSARPEPLLQIAQQVENLRLDRDVERGRRLVGDEQRRAARQRERDERALPQAARQLVRIVAHAPLRLGNADGVEELDRAVARRAPARDAVHHQRFLDLVADGEDRVQRRHRLLEDQRDLGAADLLHLLLVERRGGRVP